MLGKVFISHSSKDQQTADAIRQHLESAGLACWIARRDIEAGAPRNSNFVQNLALTFYFTRQFALNFQLSFALVDRDWVRTKELIKKMNGGDDEAYFAYAQSPVPIGCYSILLARLQREQTSANASFAEAREQLNQKVQKTPGDAGWLSQLGVVDALLNNKAAAIAAAKRAVEMSPISKDAVAGTLIELNLAVVYTWTNELDLAFETLNSLAKIPAGLYYGELKRDPYWEPLRQDPRYEKLLAELAPKR